MLTQSFSHSQRVPPLPQLSRHWRLTKDGDPRALALYERHYSCRRYADGRRRKLFCGPGQKLVLIMDHGDAVLAWRKFIDHSGQTGVNCVLFRNENGRGSGCTRM